jgi:hypothetical protein
MPTYFKRHCDELRGDEHNAWGISWWYFEVDEKGGVLRQIEQYDSGVRLCYGEQHIEDEFGGLGQTALDLSESGYTAISSQDVKAAWSLS